MNKADKYCDDVLTGNIPSGVNLRNACIRYKHDRSNGFAWKEEEVEKKIKFIHKLKHFTGIHAGKPFKLEPWQTFIIANLYGFYNKDGTRRFQTAYIEVARKNGKSALVDSIAIDELMNGNEPNPEILIAANSKEQAKVVFDIAYYFCFDRNYGIDYSEHEIRSFRHEIKLRNAPGYIKVLASDSEKLDAYNCSLGIIDEFHSAPDASVRNVIRSSMGARENPLLLTITTAGFNKALPCFELRTVASEVSAGVKEDDSLFGMIFSMDNEDDWKDPVNWYKANPNLDVTIKKSFIQKQVQQAINSPNDEVGVKTKNLNLWCDSATTWIPDQYIINASKKLGFADFQGVECFVGVDLASNVDLTAVSYLWVKDSKFNFITEYYVPRETLETRVHADIELYKQWVGNKYMKTTAGNVTDYDYITRDLLAIDKESGIANIYYDKYNANQWAIQCTEQGLKMEQFSQTIGNFNICTRAFERMMLNGQINIDDNPITRYCLRNVELRFDFNGNCKPNKCNEKRKIDGVISMLQALAAYLKSEEEYKGINIF